jgi:hypothetical protein
LRIVGSEWHARNRMSLPFAIRHSLLAQAEADHG